MTKISGEQEIHLRDYLYILRKRRFAILAFFIFILFCGVLYTAFEKVLYRATATVLIERENPNVIDFKEVLAMDASTTDYYQTQYKMLESQSLIESLIQKEKLEEDPFIRGLQRGRLRPLLKTFGENFSWLHQFVVDPSTPDLIIRRMLRIDPVRNSRLVRVSVLHPDPRRSAELTNSLVDLFIERNLQDRFLVSERATELISRQLIELKDKVSEAERKLQAYKEQKGLVNIPSIREKDKFVQDARLELVKLQSVETKFEKRYLPAHPKLIHLRSQIEGLKSRIEEEEKKALELSRVAIEYSELEREAESSRGIYEALLARLQETQSQGKTQASNILIVDHADAPPRPYKPRPFINLLMAVSLGTIGGVLLAFFLEYLDSTIKIPDDIEKGLGLELFGIIPEADINRKDPLKGGLFLFPSQHSPISESFRALRTTLLFHLRQMSGCRKILITSPNPDEGKSTVALNLAAAFQQNRLRVLLIDADLRKPRSHGLFNVESQKGLTDVLEGEMPLKDAVHQNAGEVGFNFISCGTRSHHPTEILGSKEMKNILSELEKNYDIILLDSPPYLPVADVAVLSEYADAILVVARYHRTDKRHLRDIKKRFSEAGPKILGIVVNRVSVQEKDYYYHQYYYYGYGDATVTSKK